MTFRVLRVRHETAPMPMGCRWCGVVQQGHPRLWAPSVRFHAWAHPTREQIAARLRIKLSLGQKPSV